MTVTAISASRGAYRETADGSLEVKIIIDPRFKEDFHRMFAEKDMPVALAPLAADFERLPQAETAAPDKPAVQTGETGHWVSALYKSGWFFNPKVLSALGTDDEYRQFIQRQPSCVSGEFGEFVNGEGRSVAAHVRRAGESGTGSKAPYACVPMSDAEHQKQHTQGESAFHGGAEFFDKQRAKYLQVWGHAQLRVALGVESLTDTTPESLREWAHDHGVFSTLPLAVREM